jgi:YcxB-like protein
MDGPRVAAGAATGREPFELTFRTSAADYQAFQRKVRWSGVEWTMALLPSVGAFAIGMVAGLLAAFAVEKADGPGSVAIAMIVGGAVVYVVYRLALMPAYYRSMFAGQPVALGDTRLVVDARGIASNMGPIVLALPWASLQRVVDTDSHVFLVFARLAGVIIPKRAFGSSDEARRFVTFARSLATGARK